MAYTGSRYSSCIPDLEQVVLGELQITKKKNKMGESP